MTRPQSGTLNQYTDSGSETVHLLIFLNIILWEELLQSNKHMKSPSNARKAWVASGGVLLRTIPILSVKYNSCENSTSILICNNEFVDVLY